MYIRNTALYTFCIRTRFVFEHDREKCCFLLQLLISLLVKLCSSKYNLCYMYIMCAYIIKYKVMMIINIIIRGKTEEWGFVLN